ncbi:MAG: serine/threonine-protein kinase, partial [Bacteroidia bacterium]
MSQLDPEIWAIVSEQFHTLVDLPVREQRESLERLKIDHPAAYEPLLKLLAAESTLHPVLQTGSTHPWQVAEDETLVGTEIGIYRLIEHVGSGGMGSVFLAERTTEDFDRKEALKLIRPGGLQEESVRRFKQERQILANLTHPGIARLYDGGTTAEGRLYFTMEHVEGQDIITYLESRDAGLAERLALFHKVAEAISYAHSRLVLHLDLKPSNILVTEAGEVKILDFGVAERLNEEEVSFSSELTEATHRYTLAYGSPEQLQGETLSTQSDIYTLGVLLYQILVGQLPFGYETDSL